MSEQARRERSRIVLVVGVDLSDVSEHLLAKTRDLVRSVDEVELHVVHVVHPESLRERLVMPGQGLETRAQMEAARWQLDRLCETIAQSSRVRSLVHTPVGHAADELTRIARDVHADVVVIEAHDRTRPPMRRAFHRSVVARIAQIAPCSVLTIRPPRQNGHVAGTQFERAGERRSAASTS
jgi:nucleotide-binding universal stress UspA family protein